MDKAELIKEHPVLGRLETILRASLLPEELDALALFVDSVEYGFSDFIAQLNYEVNPQNYSEGGVDWRKKS